MFRSIISSLPSTCCACRYNYCESDCFAIVSRCRLCCLTSESHACQTDCHNHEACCILASEDTEIVTDVPNDCRCYRRCCCLEVIWGCPCTGYMRPAGNLKIFAKEGKEVLMEVIPLLNPSCCNFYSLYFTFPGCLSCYSQRYCCCCKEEAVVCKPMCNNSVMKDNRLKCIVRKSTSTLSQNMVCCKCIDQCLCLDHRCAQPTDEDVPCLCMMAPGCVLCVNGRCTGVLCCQQLQALGTQAHGGRVAPLAQAELAA
ncbi:hypothetical protein EON64_14405, partial [archaeon]